MNSLVLEFETALIRLKDAHYELLFTGNSKLVKKLRRSLEDLEVISEKFVSETQDRKARTKEQQ